MIPHYRTASRGTSLQDSTASRDTSLQNHQNRQDTRIVSIAGHKEEKLLHYSLKGNLGRFTWVRPQQPPEQRYPYLLECAVFQRVRANTGIASVRDSYRAHTLR